MASPIPTCDGESTDVCFMTRYGTLLSVQGEQVTFQPTKCQAFEVFRLTRLAKDVFSLQTHAGKFVGAENGGGDRVFARANQCGPWETFDLSVDSHGLAYFRSHSGLHLLRIDTGSMLLRADSLGVEFDSAFAVVPRERAWDCTVAPDLPLTRVIVNVHQLGALRSHFALVAAGGELHAERDGSTVVRGAADPSAAAGGGTRTRSRFVLAVPDEVSAKVTEVRNSWNSSRGGCAALAHTVLTSLGAVGLDAEAGPALETVRFNGATGPDGENEVPVWPTDKFWKNSEIAEMLKRRPAVPRAPSILGGFRVLDPFNRNSIWREAGRSLDPFVKNSVIRAALCEFDPFCRNAGLGKLLRSVDPTNNNSIVAIAAHGFVRGVCQSHEHVRKAWDRLPDGVKGAIVAASLVAAGAGLAVLVVQGQLTVTVGVAVLTNTGASVFVPVVEITAAATSGAAVSVMTLAQLLGVDDSNSAVPVPASGVTSIVPMPDSGPMDPVPGAPVGVPIDRSRLPVIGRALTPYTPPTLVERFANSLEKLVNRGSWSMGSVGVRPGGGGAAHFVDAPSATFPFLGTERNYALVNIDLKGTAAVGAAAGKGLSWTCSAHTESKLMKNGVVVECAVVRTLLDTPACSAGTVEVSAPRVIANVGIAAYAVHSSVEYASKDEVCSTTMTHELHVSGPLASAGVALVYVATHAPVAVPAVILQKLGIAAMVAVAAQ
eukprot:TRINITY_DN4042_c2_g3_i1.p1 TRINITY_DN4042_c2_g3~~TRINITY_DN4042_c2_g3_i1.p1  ORF type:complete len:716 (+),score=135.05 TRINITY_DN4042_c2_g3_i1:162-2309(+)